MTTLRELERELLSETGKRLARFGFSPRPKGQSFYRKFEGGLTTVHLSFIKHQSDFDVTADVAVRFDAVEELVQRSNTLLSAKEKATTFTLGAELGNLERGEPYRFTVAGPGDLAKAADDIETTVERVGMPYLEQYSRPEAAYNLLSRDDRDVWFQCPGHAGRAKRACAMLAAMGRHSEIKDLAAKKLAFLESIKEPLTGGFSRFLSEL